MKIFLFLMAFFAHGVSATVTVEDQIDQVVKHFHNKKSFHGNVNVMKGDQVIYSNSIGTAIDAFNVPHSNNSRFMIASVSKQFTAAAIMQLVEEEKIKLDDTYGSYIPWKKRSYNSKEEWNSFTIRQLLNHTAGIVKDIEASPYASNETYSPILSATVGNMIRHNDIFIYNKSDTGSYSNFGYMLLAYLIEKVSGEYFHDYLERNIFSPLGMDSTGQYHRMFNIKYMAEGYAIADGTNKLQKRCCFDATSFVGSHSLYSDVEDLMLWLWDISSDSSAVLSESSIKEMTKAQSVIDSNKQYGFGFVIDEWNGHKRIWHDGMETGYLSIVSIVKDLDLRVVILSNKHGSDIYTEVPYPHKMVDEILEIVAK